MARLGIAVTTYNRREMLLAGLGAIQKLTSIPFDLVVCDDGSIDGTAEAVEARGITLLGGTNKGIAWNKNRGLFYLSQQCRCDTIILLDDDAHPILAGWEQEWIRACQRFGHINYIPPHYRKDMLAGKLNSTYPGIGATVGGMAIGQSAAALSCVGYMDVRFGRYGHEHSDFSGRFKRAGFGGFAYQGPGDNTGFFYLIDGGIELISSESTGSDNDLTQNAILLGQLANDPIYRPPWRNDAEMHEFLSEMPVAFRGAQDGILPPRVLFSAASYLAEHDDVREAELDPLEHFVRIGSAEGRTVGQVLK